MSVLRSIEERAESAAGAPTTTVTISGAVRITPCADSDGHLWRNPAQGFGWTCPTTRLDEFRAKIFARHE